uniref:Gypsy retrotransposon integrase-like protein 1 n=1 Tax=Pygocentrus nattereri TaxID=42514 RepID=A0AAR2JKB7_PYGNA
MHATLKQAHMKQNCRGLPKGLVGTKCTAQIKIGHAHTSCLLDTGSQVTTVSHSFFQKNLSDHQINSLSDLLEVEGANGQSVPYLGYVELSVVFPKEFTGIEVEVPTLALVVPDTTSESQPHVLIGTNTLDVLYETASETAAATPESPLYGYRAVLKVLELRQCHHQGSAFGFVKLHDKTPQLISAGQFVVVNGCAVVKEYTNETKAILEHPTWSSLPGGLLVQPCLIDVPSQPPYKVSVMLKNESERDIVIPPKCILAELSVIQTVLSQQQSVNTEEVNSDEKPKLSFNFGDSPVSAEWKDRITKKLNSMPEVFAQSDIDFGRTDRVKHHIKLSDETPFKHRARPIHPHDLDAVRRHLQELLQAGIIRESESPFSSPIVVVRKKNGEVRLCVDYRKLNLQTVKDAYALPNLEETFSALTGSKWFTVLDLKSGYYQIEVEEADKPKTAFVCPLGFWEFNRMAQGITNAPSTFQRLMEKCVGDMNLREVVVFLDDVIVFSKTLEEHEIRLMRVLSRLKEYGLKLSPAKCRFFQTSVRYLGHIVSQSGVETDPDKVEALKTWPRPQNLKQLRSFLGFSGYYRRFIKDYSSIVKPLTDLTSGYPPLRKSFKHKAKDSQYHDPKESFGGRWTSACGTAFNTIITKLTTAPVLGFADSKIPYVLHTDASTTGLGAALYQEQEGIMRVIAYASRGLSRSESKYPAHKLEFLALKWAVTEKFNDYLYGSNFTVITDSNPLTYILTTAKMDATSYRWLAALSTFTFKLKYRAGKQNSDADGLSRRSHGGLTEDVMSQKERERICQFTHTHLDDSSVSISKDAVYALCEKHLVNNVTSEENSAVALVQSLAVSSDAIPDSFASEDQHGGLPIIPHFSEEEIRDKQRADPCIREVISMIETGEKLVPAIRTELPQITYLLRQLSRLSLHNQILYRRRLEGSTPTYQLVLPEELCPVVLKSLHDDMGHMGIDRTMDLIRTRFYWPKLADDVERKVKTCERCVRRKSLPEKAAPLTNIVSTRPLELVCMDFLSIEPDSKNTKDVLVLTDHFTKYAIAIPTPNQKAQTVAKCLWDNLIVQYGIPECLHSDQGPDFESHVIKELCQLMGIRKTHTT